MGEFLRLLFRTEWIYPGQLWTKRIFHLLALCTIGGLISINGLQGSLIDLSQDIFNKGTVTSIEAVDGARDFFNAGQFRTAVLEWFGSTQIQDQLAGARDSLVDLQELSIRLHGVAKIISIISSIFLFGVALSAVWIFLDYKHGDVKRFLRGSLIAVLAFNLISWAVLEFVWMKLLQPFNF